MFELRRRNDNLIMFGFPGKSLGEQDGLFNWEIQSLWIIHKKLLDGSLYIITKSTRKRLFIKKMIFRNEKIIKQKYRIEYLVSLDFV